MKDEKEFKVGNFVIIHRQEIEKETIVITPKTRLWCGLPYPDHPTGCPNKNKTSCKNTNLFDPSPYSYFYLIYADFDFRSYKDEKSKIPKWKGKSERAVGNLLHWQGSIKRMLKDYIKPIWNLNLGKGLYLLACGSGFGDKKFRTLQDPIYSMEAMGIYVFGTLKKNGIKYDLKANENIKLVCLLCSKEKVGFERKTINNYF